MKTWYVELDGDGEAVTTQTPNARGILAGPFDSRLDALHWIRQEERKTEAKKLAWLSAMFAGTVILIALALSEYVDARAGCQVITDGGELIRCPEGATATGLIE